MLKHQEAIDKFLEWRKNKSKNKSKNKNQATQSYFELPEDAEVNFDEELDCWSELKFADE